MQKSRNVEWSKWKTCAGAFSTSAHPRVIFASAKEIYSPVCCVNTRLWMEINVAGQEVARVIPVWLLKQVPLLECCQLWKKMQEAQDKKKPPGKLIDWEHFQSSLQAAGTYPVRLKLRRISLCCKISAYWVWEDNLENRQTPVLQRRHWANLPRKMRQIFRLLHSSIDEHIACSRLFSSAEVVHKSVFSRLGH